MKSKMFLFFVILFVAMAGVAMAQETDELAELIKDLFGLQVAVIATIQTAMAGAIMAVTNFLKTLLHVKIWTTGKKRFFGYGVTFLGSVGATYFVLRATGTLTLAPFIGYVIYTWGVSNQIYKMLKNLIKQHTRPERY